MCEFCTRQLMALVDSVVILHKSAQMDGESVEKRKHVEAPWNGGE